MLSVEKEKYPNIRFASDFEISENAPFKTVDEFVKEMGHLINEDMLVIRVTESLCPGCVDEEKFDQMRIPAIVYEEGGDVKLIKECPEHGITTEKYWEDYEMFEEAKKWQDPGIKLMNPNVAYYASKIVCPTHCGLCVKHKSHTGLGNIVVTNRCDLSCWYCFFYAKENEPIYEPTQDQIRMMLRRMKNEKPVGANAVQITGGEPTMRDDIIDIVRIAREEGYDHVQLNTNSVRAAFDPDFVRKVREAGSNVIYTSFDGPTPRSNPKNFWEIPDALENYKKAPLGVVLVPTVIGGVNDMYLGDIIRFGLSNIDVVRAVNFQPVSLVGRMPDRARAKQRITIPGAIKKIEQQTDGLIGREDFFTVPSSAAVSNFVAALKGRPTYKLSIHYACGMGTYLFKDDEKVIPVTRFVDVKGMFEYIQNLADEIEDSTFKSLKKVETTTRLLYNLKKFVDYEKAPKDFKLKDMVYNAFTEGDYHGLKAFHYKSMFIGFMHFQDPYTYDVDRVERCDIHYAMPDGRVIPFCAFNVIPELYRDSTQRKYSIPAKVYEEKTGRSLKKEKYFREYSMEDKKRIIAFYERSIGRKLTEEEIGQKLEDPIPVISSQNPDM
ncbi:molybdenum cofactor biosynthesis protein [Thermoplasma volcanium GSS1]|uniref:Molybdenum cofactor biosynthesis protein n=2 Tax=Thermoplasma volcanium TaxID=50339 RepID=Q97A50_THEVO|nr:radical SAM protein [Thermoplasma volcanium]BAB60102.1 molybdenum cofactor biosynthesis protein [Thermoplasma volcanium GSS1]